MNLRAGEDGLGPRCFLCGDYGAWSRKGAWICDFHVKRLCHECDDAALILVCMTYSAPAPDDRFGVCAKHAMSYLTEQVGVKGLWFDRPDRDYRLAKAKYSADDWVPDGFDGVDIYDRSYSRGDVIPRRHN